MKAKIIARKFTVDDKTRDYVAKKLAKLDKFFMMRDTLQSIVTSSFRPKRRLRSPCTAEKAKKEWS